MAVVTGYCDALAAEAKARLAQAWHTAALGRVTPMPELADVLGEEREPQDDVQMAHALMQWEMATAPSGVAGVAEV